MVRSLWKGPFVHNSILNQIHERIKKKLPAYKIIKIWSRTSTIFPSFVGLTFDVYNGIKFITILINDNMVGKKFGEFIHTCKAVKHKKKK